MAPILEGEALRKHVHPISVAFYHAASELGLIEERVELLQGVIFDKMSKSPLLYTVFQTLLDMLNALKLTGSCIRSEGPLTTPDSEPEPDLAVCVGSKSDYFDSHPTTAEFVIEVAISSIEIDRKKAEIYAAAGVPEYWIVMPKLGEIEVYRDPKNGAYESRQTFSGDTEVKSATLPDFKARIPALFLPSTG